MNVEIITNRIPRPILQGFEIAPDELAEFDYLDDPQSASFFRYKGALYDLGTSPRLEPQSWLAAQAPGWRGLLSETAFSGLLVRLSDDGDSVVIGRYYTK